MLRNLKDRLRSEMDVWEVDSAKNDLLNDAITDFVDMLIALKDGEIKKARSIKKYLVDVLDDLDVELGNEMKKLNEVLEELK